MASPLEIATAGIEEPGTETATAPSVTAGTAAAEGTDDVDSDDLGSEDVGSEDVGSEDVATDDTASPTEGQPLLSRAERRRRARRARQAAAPVAAPPVVSPATSPTVIIPTRGAQPQTESARFLTRDLGLSALVGPAASGDAQAVFGATDGTVIMSPSATSPLLTTLDSTRPTDAEPGRLWRTCPPDSLQAVAMARDLTDRSILSIALINESGPYGDELARLLNESYSGSADLYQFSTEGERETAIEQAAAGSFQEVVFVSSQTADVIAFLDRAATSPAFTDVGIMVSDSAANLDLVMQTSAAARPLLANIRGTRPAAQDPSEFVYSSFASAFQTEYGESPNAYTFVANTFDATWMLFYGAAWSSLQEGGVSSLGIARGLRRVSEGPSLQVQPASWATVQQSFSRGESVDIRGSSGELDFDPANEETSTPVEIWRFNADLTGIEVVGRINP